MINIKILTEYAGYRHTGNLQHKVKIYNNNTFINEVVVSAHKIVKNYYDLLSDLNVGDLVFILIAIDAAKNNYTPAWKKRDYFQKYSGPCDFWNRNILKAMDLAPNFIKEKIITWFASKNKSLPGYENYKGGK